MQGKAESQNQYQFPDGRIVNADSTIYSPYVICDYPDLIYDDYYEFGDDP